MQIIGVMLDPLGTEGDHLDLDHLQKCETTLPNAIYLS